MGLELFGVLIWFVRMLMGGKVGKVRKIQRCPLMVRSTCLSELGMAVDVES